MSLRVGRLFATVFADFFPSSFFFLSFCAHATNASLLPLGSVIKIRFSEKKQQQQKNTKNRIQTQKGSHERLFILTRTHSMQMKFLWKSPLSSHKVTNLKSYKLIKIRFCCCCCVCFFLSFFFSLSLSLLFHCF